MTSTVFTVSQLNPHPYLWNAKLLGSKLTGLQTVDGYLAVDGNSQFYAAAVPGNQVKETVSTSSQSVSVQFAWQSK